MDGGQWRPIGRRDWPANYRLPDPRLTDLDVPSPRLATRFEPEILRRKLSAPLVDPGVAVLRVEVLAEDIGHLNRSSGSVPTPGRTRPARPASCRSWP